MAMLQTTKLPSERWMQLGTGLGLLLGLLLLGNTIWSYSAVTRRVAADRVRREAGEQVSTLERALQSATSASAELARAIEQSQGSILWLRIRDLNGTTLAEAGTKPFEPATSDQLRARLRNRQPSFEVRATAWGDVLMETMPLRWHRPSTQAATVRPFLVMDAAFRVKPEARDALPFRRSLIINSSAALALLIALSLVGLKMRAYFRGQQLEREAQIAGEVQKDLLAGFSPLPNSVEVAAHWRPASQVGGDFYDVFPMADGRIGFALGDVSGKGLPAALLMGVLHGAIRTSCWTNSTHSHEEATEKLNRLLCENAARHRFASLFWGCLDPRTGRLDYVNAGHLPPLLVRPGRQVKERLTTGGPVLGLLPQARYRHGSVWLEPSDILVLYSDGIVEATDGRENPFEEHRLISAVDSGAQDSAQAICDRVLQAVRDFHHGPDLEDDQTLLVLRFVGSKETVDELQPVAA
ncbi:MAG: serine/threonine-protein phosphatase [Bryobacteraceae bacterium]|nr:serine/threonine-protein phosphatase [Bryobacteraceae bacterium]MDW8377040.1 PP2C family protein-serine/threonine phosphatase [Bryobacterales bacterium]